MGPSEQGQGDVAIPGGVATHLVLVQPDLSLGLLEAFLNRPASPDDPHYLGHRGVHRALHPIVGQLARITQAAVGEQPMSRDGDGGARD
jgi:hypothetical protein